MQTRCVLLALVALAAVGGCSAEAPRQPEDPFTSASAVTSTPTLSSAGPQRGGNAAALDYPYYAYAPTVMYEDGIYKAWWCGEDGGGQQDHILYAEAALPNGPWHAHESTAPNTVDTVFESAGAGTWDSDVCDPSVVHVGSTYYLYYTGAGGDVDPAPHNRVGLATSPDGIHWTRANGGAAIVLSEATYEGKTVDSYGAGQPSVLSLGGDFYMMYTDTTGANGAGQYVLRSADPAFQSGVEELSATGFTALTASDRTEHLFLAGSTMDWGYVDSIGMFVVAQDARPEIDFHVFDASLAPVGETSIGSASAPYYSEDGPGLISGPDKHLVPSGICNVLALDVLRTTTIGCNPLDPTAQQTKWCLPMDGTWMLGLAGGDVAVNGAQCLDGSTVTAATGCGGMAPNRGLADGQEMLSCSGRYRLTMQTDGNLVLYDDQLNEALWWTSTNVGPNHVVMQADGNLVVYSNTDGKALWASGTSGHAGATLAVQGDGNLVIYDGGTAIWNTGTEGR